MSYPLIILGAGASHDYVHPDSRPSSFIPPPITDHLVKPHFFEQDISERYKEVQDLFSSIAPIINTGKKNLEESLSQLQNNASVNKHAQQQLIALRFYLKEFFQKISARHHPVNNYKALIARVRASAAPKALVVSFNYDTLFEQSVGWQENDNIDHYIRGDIKLIKIHGSCDWSYISKKDAEEDSFERIKSSFEYLKMYPQHKMATPYHDKHIGRYRAKRFHEFPALAIPLPGTKSFICPEHHVERLRRDLGAVDKVLIIGWKAGDTEFVEFLKENLSQPVQATIVSGSAQGLKEVESKLGSLKNFEFSAQVVGFSNFIAGVESNTFFGTNF